jgi:hypothetical protein
MGQKKHKEKGEDGSLCKFIYFKRQKEKKKINKEKNKRK